MARSDDESALEWRPGRSIPGAELILSSDTSGGPGGQHANRSATRVTLLWSPEQSAAFDEHERARLLDALRPRLNREGFLRIRSGAERSARQNRRECFMLLAALVREALRPVRRRKKTKRTRTSVARRLESKTQRARTKQARRKDYRDD